MTICPYCHIELNDSSLAEGRCAHCGRVVPQVPTRKVQDVPRDPQEFDPESPPVEPSAEPTVKMASEDTLGELFDVDLSDLDDVGTDDADADDADADDADTDDSGTDDSGTVQLYDAGTVELSAGVAKPLDEPPSEPTLRTLVASGDQTIDFDSHSDEDSKGMVTSQWAANIADGADAASDVNCTIRQKETISATYVTSSSLVVKSRRVRTRDDAGKSFESPDDAPDYELLDVLGEGGMGVVYSARQSSIARTVAVKMLKDDTDRSDSQRDKFVSEAVITGELDHPNIVPIYDLGSNDSGALFYSMKRVKGTPWQNAIKANSLDENIDILLRVADAVAFAHDNGVVHRDLKPENVMLGDYGEVLLMDWGLARISPEFPNAKAVSQSAVMGGTPAYMAPEMATGPIELITTASDVYLLGAMLFEVITGRPPHKGKTVMACLFAAAKNKIVDTEASGELYDMALRAMATQPSDRYASVQDFQAAIRRYQSHSESVVLTESAASNLAEAEQTNDYELHSLALYGFQEALSLWDQNNRAKTMLVSSRLAYAGAALANGDFDLGISLLDADEKQHAELLEKLKLGRRERESRQRRLTAFKRVAALLLVAMVSVATIAYFIVREERNIAIVAEQDALVSAEAEKTAKEKAQVAEQEALDSAKAEKTAREKAQIAEQEALDSAEAERIAKDKAQIARHEEEVAKLAAEASAKAEKLAKRAEQYEAYVARIGLAKAKIDENAFDRATELLRNCDPQLTNWEWGRLQHLCHLSVQTWDTAGPVDAVAFSPDGLRFATGDWNGKARIWSVDTGEVLHEFSQGQYAHAVAFDVQGERLAVGSSDHTVRIYDVEGGQLLQPLDAHTDHVVSVRFSPDGQWLLSSGFDKTARLWNLETGEVQQVFRGHTWTVWGAEFSPDGQRIVTAGQDGKAIVWQRAESSDGNVRFEKMTEFTKHVGPIYAARFSPDGRQIATAGHDRRVLVWNPDEVRPVEIKLRLEGKPDPPAPFLEFVGHRRPVQALAFSPDGKTLVSGGQDNVLHVWELGTGRRLETLRGHASHVRSCDFSADGKWLLSGSHDQKIKLWEPGTPSDSLILGGDVQAAHDDAVLSARFSRDGTQIVTASRDRTAAVWDVAERSRQQIFQEGHDFLASTAQFFSDDNRVATGAGDGSVRIWDVAMRTEILHLTPTGRMAALDVSEDGRWIATGSSGNDATVWDVHSGEPVATLSGHEVVVTAVRFAKGANLLVTGDDRGHCRIWKREAATGEWVGGRWLRGHDRTITALAFTKGASRLVTSSGDSSCGQWDLATGTEITELVLTHPKWVTDMDVSGDGKLALTSCEDGRLRLWSLQDARLLRTLIAPTDDAGKQMNFTSAEFSPDGRQALATCSGNWTVHLWDLAEEAPEGGAEETAEPWLDFRKQQKSVWAARYSNDGTRVLTIGGNDARLWDLQTRKSLGSFSRHGAVASADISPDGNLLVTGSWDKTAKIWDMATGRAQFKLDGGHEDFVTSVEFSPDGQTILSASYDKTARLWDVATGKPLETVFRGHKSRVRQARFSSDARRVLTVSDDHTARIWDARTGQKLMDLVGHQWAVFSGEFSRDGRRVITGSEDKTAIVWDAENGKALLTLAGHTAKVTAVAFSPDGTRVLTGSDDNTAKLWDARTGEEVFYDGKEILTLSGHTAEVTSVSFSPDGRQALTSGRDGRTILWPAVDWRAQLRGQAALVSLPR